jgi:phosphate transport system substrate-binding protein
MTKMNRNRSLWVIILPALFISAGAKMQQTTITIKGSDTMVILAQRWAETYMKNNPSVDIQVTGGGSGVGIAALINGTTDIATSSRTIKSAEIAMLKARYNTLGVQISCAKDAITVFLNESNPVTELTLQQVSDIYQAKITNWKQVGGVDAQIKLYGRENNSGTYAFFRDEVVKGDYAASCQKLPGTAAVVHAVKKDKYGIGYGGAAYVAGVKYCLVKKDGKAPGIGPTEANIINNTYPISRQLYLYLRKRPAGESKKFVDWIMSPAGQKIITEVGYFPVK